MHSKSGTDDGYPIPKGIPMLPSMVKSDDSSSATFSRVEHQKVIVAKFLAIVEDSLDRPLNMEDTSRDIGVASRSLRYALKSILGISPSQFALRRRMDMARDALQRGNCTVKDVARRFGFWEMGRFAISYRKLYGEPPSITLKRASGIGRDHQE
jgi:AraC-like DNA-binding protein